MYVVISWLWTLPRNSELSIKVKKLEQSIIKQTKIQKELQIKIDEKKAEQQNAKEINENNIRIQNEKNRQAQEEAAQARAARNEIVRAESKFLAFIIIIFFYF